MDSFKGSGQVDVQPGTLNKPLRLRLKACSASTKNDGSMPFGSTVISATISAHYAQTGAASTVLVTKSTESGNTVIAYLSYSTALTPGIYHLTARVTMSVSGSTRTYREDFDFNRVFVRDR